MEETQNLLDGQNNLKDLVSLLYLGILLVMGDLKAEELDIQKVVQVVPQ